MTAKDYLSQARQLDQAIDARLERIARLRALVSGRAARTDGMPRGQRRQCRFHFFRLDGNGSKDRRDGARP